MPLAWCKSKVGGGQGTERTMALRRGVRTSTMCGRGRVSACRALYGDFAGAERARNPFNDRRRRGLVIQSKATGLSASSKECGNGEAHAFYR